jgi:hypothetical protein
MTFSKIVLKRWPAQLVLTACLGGHPVAAQLASGTVTDDAGDPVVGAQVIFIEHQTDGRSHAVATNSAGFYQIDLSSPTTIGARATALPATTQLLANYPNPFNPTTLIPYRLSRDGPVGLTIYNVLGQPIRRLVSSTQTAGDHAATWDGRTDGGQAAATGVYLVQLRTADAVEARKMVLLDGAVGRRPGVAEFTPVRKTASIDQLGDRLFTVDISSGDLLLYRQRGLALAANNLLDFQVPHLEAQITLEGSFRISTSEELEELLQPTLNRPFRIAGGLVLRRLAFVDLAALSNLESVGGNLTLFGNQNLESLTGLENLVSVGGRLRIVANGSLKNLDALTGLQMVGGTLDLDSNQSLASIEGISHLFPSFTGDLLFALSPVTGLEPLRRLPVDIVGRLSLYLREAPQTLEILSHVQTIGGGLVLAENYILDSLEGLHNLRRLGGSLSLLDNRRLKTLEGLRSLESIGGGLFISRDRTLKNLHGLETIHEMGGGISVFAADSLVDLNGLEQLTRLGGDLILLFNGGLRSLNGLRSLSQLDGDLQIVSNPRLGSIAELGNVLDRFDGRFILEFTPALVDVDMLLGTREHLGFSLSIAGSEAPSNLAFLRNLTRVEGDLEITSAGALEELTGLSNLHSVGGNLRIENNGQIRDLSGLESLANVGGGLQIRFNRRLTSIEGLNNLTSVLDTLRIDGNPTVENLNALANLTGVPAAVIVWNNDRLMDLFGLGGITNIAGDLIIGENNDLTNLRGLGNLVHIGGNLAIGILITNLDRTRGGNRRLLSLEGLNQLAFIGGTLDIRGNPALLDLSALGRLGFLGGTLTVADNDLLTHAVIGALTNRLAAGGFAGEVVVERNGGED